MKVIPSITDLTTTTALNAVENKIPSITVLEINLWSYVQDADFTLGNSSFGAVKLPKNADPEKYFYSGYSIGFGAREIFYYMMIIILVRT